MKNILLLAFLFVIVSACNPQKYCAKHANTVHDTTIVTRDVVHDSIVDKLVPVPVAVDSSAIRAKLTVDSAGNIHVLYIDSIKVGKHVQPAQISIEGNVLTATCKVDSFAVYAAVKDKYHSSDRDSINKVTNVVKVPVEVKVSEPYIPFVAKVFMFIGIIFVVVKITKKAYKLWKTKK